MAPSSLLRRGAMSRAMEAIEAGSVVSASPYCATPTTLLRGLADRAERVPDIVLLAGLLLGEAPYVTQVQAGRLRFRTWHVSPEVRTLVGSGGIEYVPLRARAVADHLQGRADVALVRVTRPDARGNCSLGPSASYTRSLLRSARIRIAEIDPEMPRTLGADVTYPYHGFDHVIDADTPMCSYPGASPSAQSTAIAAHVASLITDGAVLQLGIGAVPDAVARALSVAPVRDLRIVGMLSDGSVAMIEAGRVASGPGALQVVELLGSDRLFRFAHENITVEMLSSHKVHDPAWLAAKPGLISVCSALEVDLSGQVASEEANGRLIAGIGGSVDFFEGAGLSPGGVRIIALPAVTAGGRSRVRASLGPTPVTIGRHSVDYVVTEYGVARVAGLSVSERAEALLGVAAPEHRAILAEEWVRHRSHKEKQ